MDTATHPTDIYKLVAGGAYVVKANRRYVKINANTVRLTSMRKLATNFNSETNAARAMAFQIRFPDNAAAVGNDWEVVYSPLK